MIKSSLNLLRTLFGSKTRASATTGGVAAMAMTVSLIGGFEGNSLKAYYDVVSVPTICQGLTKGVKIGDIATQEECDERFAAELQVFEKGLMKCVAPWNELPVKTRMAMLSWAYNIGVGGACGSTAVKRFNAGDPLNGCVAMTWWNKGRVNG